MKKFIFLYVLTVFVFFGCASAPEIVESNHKYERIIFGTHRVEFDFHLENFKNFDRASALIKELIYNNKNFDEYAAFMENDFTNQFSADNYPPITEDYGIMYIYRSSLFEEFKIFYFNNSYIIIEYNYYIYSSGAAHGLPLREYFIIDIAEGKLLAIADLINPIRHETLDKAIQAKYDTYYLEENIWPPDTINFNKQNIELLWNVYSITPYSVGIITIEIPYDEADAYLTEKGRALKLSM